MSLSSIVVWRLARSDIGIDMLQVAFITAMKVLAAIAALLLVAYVTGEQLQLLQAHHAAVPIAGSFGSCLEGPC